MAKRIKNLFTRFKEKLANPIVVKRSSLAHHKNPPELKFLYEQNAEIKLLASRIAVPYPNAKFFVISDIHYYAAEKLGHEGAEWEKVLRHDRKLFIESEEIISELIKDINRNRADFVLITGDMTKDGERICHEELTKKLREIKIPVYVIPGNHDILNPDAASFHGKAEPTETVNHQDFFEIYQDFGYKGALSYDPRSLSYMIEIKPGLCLLALDTTWPTLKVPSELLVDGRISSESWVWIEEQLIWAKNNNKAVFAAQHHPFLEHFSGQIDFMPEYIIENHTRMVELFLTYGVRVSFVGHFHAQDVAMYQGSWRRVYQVMTGSPISFPCSYRCIFFQNNSMKGFTFHIKRIPSFASSLTFNTHARKKLREAVRHTTERRLKFMGVKKADREKIITSGADAFQATYVGSYGINRESTHRPILPPKDQLGFMGRIAIKAIGYAIEGMWADNSAFDDNNFNLPLGK